MWQTDVLWRTVDGTKWVYVKINIHSLRIQVLALLALTYLIVLSMAIYNAYDRRSHELAETLQVLESHAHQIAEAENQTVRYIQHLPLLISETNAFNRRPGSEDCHGVLENLVKNDTHMGNLMLVTPNGNVVCSANPIRGKLNVADRQYFKKALSSNELIVGEAITGRVSKRWVLPFALAVRDKSGHVQGVIEASLDLGWIENEFVRGKYPPDARIGLIDGKGTVLARYPDPENLIGRNISNIPFFTTLTSQRGTGTAEVSGYDNVQRVFAFSHFSDTADGPIYLWIGLSKKSVTAAADNQFTRGLLWLVALTAGTFVVAWFGGKRLVVHPINVIAGTANRLSEGDYQARTGMRYTKNELGDLARAVDDMAGALVSKSALLRLNRSLRVLIACNRVLVHAQTETQLLNDICRVIVENGGYRMAWIGIANDDEERTIKPLAVYGFEDHYLDNAKISWADTPSGQGVTGLAVRTGEAQVNFDFQNDPRLLPWRESAMRRGYRSSSAFPLMSATRAWGVLTVYSDKLDAFTDKEVELLADLAEDITFGIASLKTKNELADTRLDIIRRLMNAGEYRDSDTGSHIKRMSLYCEAIGRSMDLSPAQCELLLVASPMHDVGKIGIPDHILLKPGKLDPQEFEIIKRHPTIGADILSNPTSDLLRTAHDIALYHHEKWDGSGYPKGISGTDIPLMARIVAVADVYDALTTTRPYKRPWTEEQAHEEIIRLSGSHFDPDVVNAFIGCRAEILRIKAANPD